MTVAVVGGGASGLMAAIRAAGKPGKQVVILERQSRVGRKLAATGNGRCNLTNINISPDRYHGGADFVVPALQRTDAESAIRLFESLGLLCAVEEDGRVYPYTDQANSVVDVLRFAAAGRGVSVRCGCEVLGVRRRGKGFALETAEETVAADKLIIACGGAAGARLGGGMSGYRLLEALGHSRTELRPALVQLKTEGGETRALKGVRAEAELKVIVGGRPAAEKRGEVQFTDYGVSGPAVFDISRDALSGKDTEIILDLLCRLSEEEISHRLLRRAEEWPGLSLENAFAGMLHSRLGVMTVKRCGMSPSGRLGNLTEDGAARLAACAKHLKMKVSGSMGFDAAQVTAGGIRTDEFDPYTMESRLCPGLYAAGEVLDVDGDCGGFNLHWAWASGLAAGDSV